MDISKLFNIGVDYKDRQSIPNWETLLFTEIAFVDKTLRHANSILYQLKSNDICLSNENFFEKIPSKDLSREAFLHMGEILFIDKKNKQIRLSNHHTVSYSYLIIASGTRPFFHNEEFISGLQALMDALRVKSKIPDSFSDPHHLSAPLNHPTASTHEVSLQEIEMKKKVHHHHVFNQIKPSRADLNAKNKRLYEVQL